MGFAEFVENVTPEQQQMLKASVYKSLYHGELSEIETLSVHHVASSLMLSNKHPFEQIQMIYCQRERTI